MPTLRQLGFTLRQLRYFLAAVRAGSVTQAAYQLHVSAPSVSAAISQLEKIFGVQLFIRHHTKGLILKPEGKELFTKINKIYEELELLDQYRSEMNESLVGSIHVGCFVTVAPILVPPLMNRFKQSYPETNLSVMESNQAELLSALRDGIIDLAMTYDMNLSKDVKFRPLSRLQPYVVLPNSHPLAVHDRIEVAQLRDEPMVLLDMPLSREYFLSIFKGCDFEPNIAHRTASPEVATMMAANGLGYTIFVRPQWGHVALDGTPFVVRAFAGSVPQLRLGIVRLANSAPTRSSDAVCEICAEILRRLCSGSEIGRPPGRDLSGE
jgi:DNA-binding transcriptional LysR family regulator